MATKNFDVAKAWEQVKKETIKNKPKAAPYPPSIVKARELLLIAQNLLSKYETENSIKARDVLAISFEKTMKQYKQMQKAN
jgi:hypothetical protein